MCLKQVQPVAIEDEQAEFKYFPGQAFAGADDLPDISVDLNVSWIFWLFLVLWDNI